MLKSAIALPAFTHCRSPSLSFADELQIIMVGKFGVSGSYFARVVPHILSAAPPHPLWCMHVYVFIFAVFAFAGRKLLFG